MRHEKRDAGMTQVLDQVAEHKLELVRFLYCGGADNKIRGKCVQADRLRAFMETGVGHPWALLCFNIEDLPVEGRGFASTGEVRIVPDPDTFAVIPYLSKVGYMLSDLVRTDRTPWELCPRSFLKRMVAKARARGLQVKAAFENEFYLAREGAEGFEPIDDSHCYTTAGMDSAHEVILGIVDALREQGIAVEQYYPEYGGGQQEVTTVYAGALQAADRQLVFRETVRGIARQHGLQASFAPVPFAGRAGSGAHVHLSLWDNETKTNLFSDVRDQHGLSRQGYWFINGILQHVRGLLALTAPSVNSYRRLQPQRLSSSYSCVGPDNREATVRIASPFWGREAESTNIEYRPADASSNPYLALGSLIAAGLDGMEQEATGAQMLLTDPALLSEEERQRRGIERYPGTLAQALEELERDPLLTEALGSALTKEYLLVKRADCELFRDRDDDFEIRTHLDKY